MVLFMWNTTQHFCFVCRDVIRYMSHGLGICVTCVYGVAKFMGSTWGPTGPRWAPCSPHRVCYLGFYVYCAIRCAVMVFICYEHSPPVSLNPGTTHKHININVTSSSTIITKYNNCCHHIIMRFFFNLHFIDKPEFGNFHPVTDLSLLTHPIHSCHAARNIVSYSIFYKSNRINNFSKSQHGIWAMRLFNKIFIIC